MRGYRNIKSTPKSQMFSSKSSSSNTKSQTSRGCTRSQERAENHAVAYSGCCARRSKEREKVGSNGLRNAGDSAWSFPLDQAPASIILRRPLPLPPGTEANHPSPSIMLLILWWRQQDSVIKFSLREELRFDDGILSSLKRPIFRVDVAV